MPQRRINPSIAACPLRRSARLQNTASGTHIQDAKYHPRQLPSPSSSDTNHRHKRRRICHGDASLQLSEEQEDLKNPQDFKESSGENPVAHWAASLYWPKDFLQRGANMTESNVSKRRSESTHRSDRLERLAH